MSMKVTLCKSGNQFQVHEGETVLDAALRSGLVLPYSCRSGSCGTCKARIVSGRVDFGEYQCQALSDVERDAGMALLCQARPLEELVVDAREVSVSEEIEIKTLPCRVLEKHLLAHDVMQLILQLPKNQSFRYLPGQYVDLLLRDGRRRSFSMASGPRSDMRLELHVRRVPDGFFTDQVFAGLPEGSLLRLQGPLGTFCLRRDSQRPMLFMAGGTGIAPIKAIIEQALALGIDRSMRLFWGVRARRDLYLAERIAGWARDHANFRFDAVLSEPQPADEWQGSSGWVHEALVHACPDLSGVDVYASGPPPMIEAAKPVFRACGLPADRFYYDSFEFSYDLPRN